MAVIRAETIERKGKSKNFHSLPVKGFEAITNKIICRIITRGEAIAAGSGRDNLS